MTARWATAAAALAIGALAAGCAHLAPAGDARSYAERRDYLAGLDAWELRGRIAIQNGAGRVKPADDQPAATRPAATKPAAKGETAPAATRPATEHK